MEMDQLLLIARPPQNLADVTRLEVDGVILVDPEALDPSLQLLDAGGTPVVTVDRDLARDDGWWVGVDNLAAMADLLAHLHRRGATRIAFLTADSPWAWFADTRAAYSKWCADHGFAEVIGKVVRGDPELSASLAMTELLTGDDPPDAVVTDVYGGALGVLRAATSCGRKVPDDLLVASAVDGHALETAVPAITALDLQPMDIGRAAVQMLARRIAGEPSTGPKLVGAGVLQSRGSTLRLAAH